VVLCDDGGALVLKACVATGVIAMKKSVDHAAGRTGSAAKADLYRR
jgi:hypothetical protein